MINNEHEDIRNLRLRNKNEEKTNDEKHIMKKYFSTPPKNVTISKEQPLIIEDLENDGDDDTAAADMIDIDENNDEKHQKKKEKFTPLSDAAVSKSNIILRIIVATIIITVFSFAMKNNLIINFLKLSANDNVNYYLTYLIFGILVLIILIFGFYF